MDNIFVCADWYLFHERDFIYKPRGFKSAQEMINEIIKRHNELVAPDDIVYVLRDCVVGGKPAKEHVELIKSMNGRKFLVIGNHDTNGKLDLYRRAKIFEDIQMEYRIKYEKMNFLLTHYPL